MSLALNDVQGHTPAHVVFTTCQASQHGNLHATIFSGNLEILTHSILQMRSCRPQQTLSCCLASYVTFSYSDYALGSITLRQAFGLSIPCRLQNINSTGLC
jgi:hypothetical protein